MVKIIKRCFCNPPVWIVSLLALMCLSAPFVLTRPAFNSIFAFDKTGSIGDTIGGLTAPFVSLLGAYLVYLALKAQIKANKQVQDQFAINYSQKQEEQLYLYLEKMISDFSFVSLPNYFFPVNQNARKMDQFLNITRPMPPKLIEVRGSEAFDRIFEQIFSTCKSNREHDLQEHPKVVELISIFTLMLKLLRLLKTNNATFTLLKHQFDYRVAVRLKNKPDLKLESPECRNNFISHGLPSSLLVVLKEIDSLFQELSV